MSKKKLVSWFVAICMLISLIPTIAFADVEESPVQIEVQNAQNGKTEYQVEGGEWTELHMNQVWNIEGVSDGQMVTIRAIPNEGQILDTAVFWVNGRMESIDQDSLQTESGWSFTYTESNSYKVCITYRNGGGNPNPGDPNPENSGELRFTCQGQMITGGSIFYKLNNMEEFVKVNEESGQYSSIMLTNEATSLAIRFVANEGYQLDKNRGVTFRVNGMDEFRSTNENITDFISESGYTFNLSELSGSVSTSRFELEFGFERADFEPGPEPGPEPGEEPAHGGYEGVEAIASVTVTGKADFYINDSRMVNGKDGDSFENVRYHYDGNGFVDFYFNCFISERITTLRINGVDYYHELPDPSKEGGKEALIAACKGQLNEFKITVPYSESGYEIESNVKWLDDTDKDYMVVGNFLWTYTDENQGDDYIDHGRMELLGVYYNGRDYTAEELNNPGTAVDWGQNENGGGAVLPVGAVVTVKLIPDYGYQLTSFGINGSDFGTGDEQSTFTFVIKPGNAHLGAHFTPVADKVTSDADIIAEDNNNIRLGEGEINSGSVVLSVGNAAENVNEEGFQNALAQNEGTEGYQIASVLDINLNQVLYKGTEDDFWSNEMTQLQSPAEITLELTEDYTDVVVVHENHNGEYDVIDTAYNPEDGTITFETNSFSNYAVAVVPGVLSDKRFTVGFDEAGTVQMKIGEGDAEVAEPWNEYFYADSQTLITFTLTPPEQITDELPIVQVLDSAFENAIEIELQESNGQYSFTITPDSIWEEDIDTSFVVLVFWTEYDAFGPGEGQFMVETNVMGGEEYGSILLQPGANSGNHQSFDSHDKYLYDMEEEEDTLDVTFIPKPGMRLTAFQIGEDMYGYGMNPLPELREDGRCTMTISIPALSDTEAADFIYIEAIFEEADPVAAPTGLSWVGETAKWNAVEGADHYRVNLQLGYNFGNQIFWLNFSSGIITTTCEYDFSQIILSYDNPTYYRFTVCAIQNKVCSDEAQSSVYIGSTDDTFVTDISATITAPELGAAPDYDPVYTSTPADGVVMQYIDWYKIAVADFTGKYEDYWVEMESDEQFEEGYYYSVDMCFMTNDGYRMAESASGTVNGKPHDNTYGNVFYGHNRAYLCGLFEPLHEHTAGSEWKSDANNHWKECSVAGCNVIIEESKAAHSYGDDNICDICGYAKTVTPPSYVFLEGANSSWTQSSSEALSFRANGDFSKFTGVKVDGALIDAKNYTAVSGSTIVTFTADYQKTLSVGKHSLTILYTDGECSTSFEILRSANAAGSNNLPTGDDSNLWLWIAAALVSSAGILGITAYSRRKHAE